MNKIWVVITSTLLIYSFSYSQTDPDFYVKKTGFRKIVVETKNDTIEFITSSKENDTPKPTILFLQGSLPLSIVMYHKDQVQTLFPFDLKPYADKFNFVIIARKGIPLAD